eukprot:Gb_20077 [translate_table: standard]
MMCPPRRRTFNVNTTAPAARTAKATAKTLDLSVVADQESVSPKKMMKKKGPQRSQSRNAFPGSSRYGFGKTTSFRLLTILITSLFTVSQTGSVKVLEEEPNPFDAMFDRDVDDASLDTEGTGGTGKGEEDIGMEALGGLEGLAGSTGVGGRDAAGCTACALTCMRLSISSMSDCADWCRGTVSLSDILTDL